MLVGCDVVAALATGVLAVATTIGHSPFSLILVAAVTVELLATLFYSASAAAFRRVVPDDQLSSAMAVTQARNAAVYLAGPALGGLLFAIAPSLPFTVDAVTFGISVAAIIAIRAPLRAQAAASPRPPVHRDLFSGLAFLWRNRCLRYTQIVAALLNFVFSAIFFTVIVVSGRRGAAGGLSAGTLISCAGLGSLAGSLLAVRVKELLPPRSLVVMVTAVCAGTVTLMTVAPNAVAIGALLVAAAFMVPTANVVIGTAEVYLTPPDMQGRVQSSSSFVAQCLTPLGPLAAGLLLATLPTWQVYAIGGGVLIVLTGTALASSGLRELPDLRPARQGADRAEPDPEPTTTVVM
jgi:MFS family permease